MLSSLALLALALPGGGWTPLEAPVLCAPETAPAEPLRLADGVHVLLRQRGGDVERPVPAPRMPLSLVMQMLEEDARAKGGALEFFRSSPALLARGDDKALQDARALLADLGAQAGALEIELTCELAPVGSAATSTRVRVHSGGEAFFGSRRAATFVSGFDVEVAADSGVAQPVLGTTLTGPGVHVRAARVAGGKRVWIQGLLDLSEAGELVRFDPDTRDLGRIDQPTVNAVQVAFSGVVESGGRLEVQIARSGLTSPDWKLVLGATTRPDSAPSAAGGTGWTLLDLAFLASEPWSLQPASPGGHLAREASFAAPAPAPMSMPPSALAARLEETRANDRGPRAPLYWTNELLFLPRAEPRLAADARALIETLEAARLATGRVELAHGGFTVSFPVCDGVPARVLATRERPYLTGYRSELAPQTWMPAPEPELVVDGLGLDLAPFGGALAARAWKAASGAPEVVTKEDAQLGKLQLLRRDLWTDAARIARDERGRTLLAPEPAGPGVVSIGFAQP
ncbi:MAG: hypothetical protein U1F29_13040 [Planctomycetota bacterium]